MSEIPLYRKSLSACRATREPEATVEQGGNCLNGCTTCVLQMAQARASIWSGLAYRGTSLIRRCPTPLGPPQAPRRGLTVRSEGVAVSCK